MLKSSDVVDGQVVNFLTDGKARFYELRDLRIVVDRSDGNHIGWFDPDRPDHFVVLNLQTREETVLIPLRKRFNGRLLRVWQWNG